MTLASLFPLIVAALFIVIVVVLVETVIEPGAKIVKLVRLLAGLVFIIYALRALGLPTGF